MAGDEIAAREANVNRATIRSWRARAAKGGGVAVAGGGSAGGVVASVASPVAVDGDELVGAESELVEVRAARAAALTRSTELARAGSDVAASNAARAARDFATAARALAGEVALLRESDVRLTESQGEMLARALQDFTERLALPWAASVRELLSATIRLAAGREVPDIDRTAERAAREVQGHFARMLGRAAAEASDLSDSTLSPEVLPDRRPTSSGDGICSDPPAGQIEGEPSISADVEIPEHQLVGLAEIPVAWRSRFVFGEDGDLRARIAWTRKVRADEVARTLAAEVAAEAEAESVRVAAAERAARVPGPAPAGWDGRRGGRGRGPAGERAGE